jgi:antitoxin HicB
MTISMPGARCKRNGIRMSAAMLLLTAELASVLFCWGAVEECETVARAKAIEGETYTHTVVFEPDKEAGGYTVTCPALPGLVTEGDTLQEARAMAADAIKGYLESLRKDGEPIPLSEEYETQPIREAVTVRLEST